MPKNLTKPILTLFMSKSIITNIRVNQKFEWINSYYNYLLVIIPRASPVFIIFSHKQEKKNLAQNIHSNYLSYYYS